MPGNNFDDDYVANLLKQDAKKTAKEYDLVGIDAFNPKRSRLGAPKPNTNFLRQIIRQTDSHNASLLAREAEESRARLRNLDGEDKNQKREREIRSRGVGRLTPPDLSDNEETHHTRRHRDYSDRDDEHRSRRKRKLRDDTHGPGFGGEKDGDRKRQKEKRRHEGSEDNSKSERRTRHSRHDRGKERRHRHRHSSEEENEERRGYRAEHKGHTRRRRESHSRSPSRTHSHSPQSIRHHRSSRHRDQYCSPSRISRSTADHKPRPKPTSTVKRSRRRSPSPASDSDPLEALLGPLPPPSQPTIRPRGRGADKANSIGMDARFSSTYDASLDAQPPSDVEDDWGDAVEAFRDRQHWKQQGAERLKAAGFTEQQVKKWEKGDEKDEEDVVWAPRGHAREWDKGKVIDDDGDVDLQAEWGRLT